MLVPRNTIKIAALIFSKKKIAALIYIFFIFYILILFNKPIKLRL
jgi:hypothetical protein